jgi:hypothetical protein
MNLMAVAERIAGSIAYVARSHPLISLAAMIIIAILIYRRPKFFIVLFLIGVLITGVLFAVSTLSTLASAKKERLIEKSAPGNSSAIHGVRM